MASFILAHDIGTSGDKATLFSESGRLVASSFRPYQVYYPHAGWAEQDPEDYWAAFCASTREILDGGHCRAADIAVVAFSGQMQAALPVDREGRSLGRSLIWADQRSTHEQSELDSRVGADRVYDITGHPLSTSYSATKIMWLRRNAPEVYNRTTKFLHAKDFLATRLTGSFDTDYSDATGMNLLDIKSGSWSPEILAAAGIDSMLLPELHESTEIVGRVGRGPAEESELAAGTPVVIGGGDGASATVGAGVVQEGDAYISLGTSTWMATASSRPVLDPLRRTMTYIHFRKGLYVPCGSMQAGGGALKWFAEAVGAGAGGAPQDDLTADAASVPGAAAAERAPFAAGPAVAPGNRFSRLNERAAAVPPGSENLLFLPYLIGERSPIWDPHARGSFIGLSMVHNDAHMARAVMEGVALHLRTIREAFSECGLPFPFFRILGGAVRNRLWLQILADVLEVPVAPVLNADNATSIGAAMAGGVGVGIFASLEEAGRLVGVGERITPQSENSAIYRRLYPAFRRSYTGLAPVFEMLAGEPDGAGTGG